MSTQPEAILVNEILTAVSRGRWRWFKNMRGKAIRVPPRMISAALLVLEAAGIPASVFNFGVGPDGAPDVIGFESRLITQADVGKTYAIAHVAEVKTPTGRMRPNQTLFARVATRLGVIWHLWRGVEQAKEECPE